MELNEVRDAVETYIHIGTVLTQKELNAISVMRKFCRDNLELLDKVAAGGLEKIKYEDMPEHERKELFDLYKNGFNQAINLCNVHWAEKMKGIGKFINDWLSEKHGIKYDGILARDLGEAVTTRLTAK